MANANHTGYAACNTQFMALAKENNFAAFITRSAFEQMAREEAVTRYRTAKSQDAFVLGWLEAIEMNIKMGGMYFLPEKTTATVETPEVASVTPACSTCGTLVASADDLNTQGMCDDCTLVEMDENPYPASNPRNKFEASEAYDAVCKAYHEAHEVMACPTCHTRTCTHSALLSEGDIDEQGHTVPRCNHCESILRPCEPEKGIAALDYPLLSSWIRGTLKETWQREVEAQPAQDARTGELVAARLAVRLTDEYKRLNQAVKAEVKQWTNTSSPAIILYDGLQDDDLVSFRQTLQDVSGTRTMLVDEQEYRASQSAAPSGLAGRDREAWYRNTNPQSLSGEDYEEWLAIEREVDESRYLPELATLTREPHQTIEKYIIPASDVFHCA